MFAMIFFTSIFGVCAFVVLCWVCGGLTSETGCITAEEARQRTKQKYEDSLLTYSECCCHIDREIKVSVNLMYTQCHYWVPDYLVDRVKEHYEELGYAVREDGWLDKKYLPGLIYDRKYKLIFDWGDAE